VVIVGIDAHTRSHTAAAVDASRDVMSPRSPWARILQRSILHEWISELGSVRLVAIEGAKGFGLPITRRLLAAGIEVVDVSHASDGPWTAGEPEPWQGRPCRRGDDRPDGPA